MYHGSLITLCLCLQMVAGKFQAYESGEPFVAMLGGDAELHCFLMPQQSIKHMKISWTRALPSQVVHLYKDERDRPEKTMEEYLGRTELVKSVMHQGIVVLRILNVRPSDNGQYRCGFQHGSLYSDAVIELKVAALGSHPQFHVEVTDSSHVQLECKSEGWFPQPKIQWMDSEGGEIPAESETHTQDKGGLFHVTTSLVLREPSQKNLTCSVWNPVLNQKKEEQLSIAVVELISTTVIPVVIALAALPIMLISIGLCLSNRLKKRFKNRSGKQQNDTHHHFCQARDYAAAPTNHVEFYAESDPDGANANALGPAILAYTCVAATNPDQNGASMGPPRTVLGNAAMGEDTPKATDADLDPEAACTYPPGEVPAAQEDYQTNPDQDGASTHLPRTTFHKAETRADTYKATNTDLDPEVTCTYLPGPAPAEANDTLYSKASKAPANVLPLSKYDPENEAEIQGSKEIFTDLTNDPYFKKGLTGIIHGNYPMRICK